MHLLAADFQRGCLFSSPRRGTAEKLLPLHAATFAQGAAGSERAILASVLRKLTACAIWSRPQAMNSFLWSAARGASLGSYTRKRQAARQQEGPESQQLGQRASFTPLLVLKLQFGEHLRHRAHGLRHQVNRRPESGEAGGIFNLLAFNDCNNIFPSVRSHPLVGLSASSSMLSLNWSTLGCRNYGAAR